MIILRNIRISVRRLSGFVMSEEDAAHNLYQEPSHAVPPGGRRGACLPQYQGIKKELPDLCRGILRRARPVVNGASSFKLRHSAILTGFDSIHQYTAHAIFEYSTGGILCQALAEQAFDTIARGMFVGYAHTRALTLVFAERLVALARVKLERVGRSVHRVGVQSKGQV